MDSIAPDHGSKPHPDLTGLVLSPLTTLSMSTSQRFTFASTSVWTSFAPRIRFQQVRQQRKAWMTEALFPGYLFAFFSLTEQWRAVQYAHAVRGILRFGLKYAAISTQIVEQLREMVGPEELTVVNQGVPEVGQEITIAEGPFRGLQTVVTNYLPAKERVKVLMHLLGQEMEVEMPLTSVSPVERVHPLKSRFGLSDPDAPDGK